MTKVTAKTIIILAIALFCLACASHGQSNGRSLSNRQNSTIELDYSSFCVTALTKLAKSSGVSTKSEGNLLRIGQNSLRLNARLENEAQTQGKHLVGLAVDVEINGVSQPLTVGSVGIGDSREEAIETAVDEWAQLAGVALLGALGAEEYKDNALTIHGFLIHPGATGVRGSQDLLWSNDKHRQLLERFGKILKELQPSSNKFHSVLVMIVVKDGTNIEGESRVNGEVSAEALKAAKSFNWSPTQTSYMFKQYYILRRKD